MNIEELGNTLSARVVVETSVHDNRKLTDKPVCVYIQGVSIESHGVTDSIDGWGVSLGEAVADLVNNLNEATPSCPLLVHATGGRVWIGIISTELPTGWDDFKVVPIAA